MGASQRDSGPLRTTPGDSSRKTARLFLFYPLLGFCMIATRLAKGWAELRRYNSAGAMGLS